MFLIVKQVVCDIQHMVFLILFSHLNKILFVIGQLPFKKEISLYSDVLL